MLYTGAMSISHWPSFGQETRQTTDIDSRGRTVRGDATHSVPNFIADLAVPSLSSHTEDLAKAAEASMPRRDSNRGMGGVMEGLLLRTEALDSSRIEGIRTSVRNLFMAAAGAPSKEGAKLTYKNFSALASILESPRRPVAQETICADHATIMEGESFAGEMRESESDIVYIRGETIFKADYVPPLPRHVPELITDLTLFARRTDLSIVKKAAITHSQFECIHPFLDGNGRTGRALTQRLLLLSGFRTLPVSAAYFGMLNEYFETFRRYKDGDLDYPVKIHAIAIVAATKAITAHTADREVLLDKWEAATEAHRPARENMRKALSWISGTPAFTEDALTEAIKVSERTAKRITSELAEAEILTKTSRTAPDAATSSRRQIWEAREMYNIAERVETTAKNVAARMVKGDSDPPGGFGDTGFAGGPVPSGSSGATGSFASPSVSGTLGNSDPLGTSGTLGTPVVSGFPDSPSSPDLQSPSSLPMKHRDRKQHLADMIAETGAHPIACLPTLGAHDYGFSAWELFVFSGDDLVCRRPLEQTSFYFTGDDCEEMTLNMQSPPYSMAYSPTPYNTVIPKRSEDPTAWNFAFAAGNSDNQLFPSLRRAWQQILDAFKDVVRAQYMWRQVGVWGRFPGPQAFSPPYTPPHQKFVSEAIAHFLFIGLETFFAKEDKYLKKRLDVDAPEDYNFGYPASLRVLCKRLENASETTLGFGYYDTENSFSEEQKEAIKSIRKDLCEYKKSEFWDDVRKKKEKSERWQNEWTDTLDSMIEDSKKYPPKQQIIDYIKTCRNPRAHNSTSKREEEYYILKVGYEGGNTPETVTAEAIDIIFNFISRVNTEIFGKPDDLKAWRSIIEADALEEALALRSVFVNHEIAQAEHDGLLRNEIFRNTYSGDLLEHKCRTRLHFHMSERKSKFFRRRCEDCGGNMRLLRLEQPDFDLEVIGTDGAIISTSDCEEIVIAEGAYGYTNVILKCKDSGITINGYKLIETKELPNTVTLRITTESQTWEQECTTDTPIPVKTLSLQTKTPYAMPSFADSLSPYNPTT